MTTQNVRKKILHALHFEWTILIKYFTSYIKKCQTGTYFFGWVYLWMGLYSNCVELKKKFVFSFSSEPCLTMTRVGIVDCPARGSASTSVTSSTWRTPAMMSGGRQGTSCPAERRESLVSSPARGGRPEEGSRSRGSSSRRRNSGSSNTIGIGKSLYKW